jgi:hypothetical protein
LPEKNDSINLNVAIKTNVDSDAIKASNILISYKEGNELLINVEDLAYAKFYGSLQSGQQRI